MPLITRRWLVLAGSASFTALGVWVAGPWLFSGPIDWLTAATAVLFVGLNFFGSVCLSLWIVGFLALGPRYRADPKERPMIQSRLAYAMPIRHEDVTRVALGIRRMWTSARNAGLHAHSDFFILSDSTDPETCAAEDAAWAELVQEFGGNRGSSGRIYLIRRSSRVDYKAGNVLHFLEKHGADYDLMLVLDADSVMLGDTVRRLVVRMESSPRTAILQSLMTAVRAATPFARTMQYGLNCLVPFYSSGLKWVLGPESVYWGHNALIRIAPFMKYARLPVYPGKPPLGGRVLSQDVHEACLLGRAGWHVELDLAEGGSFEEIPDDVLGYGQRDQRWCQGDYLNSAMILGDGFTIGQRLWLGFIVSNYTLSVALLAMMMLGFALAVRQGAPFGALLTWSFFLNIPVVQLTPKPLALARNFERHRAPGAQLVTAALDVVGSYVLGPLLMYPHLTFVLAIWLGHASPWLSPSRNPRERLSWSHASQVFFAPTLIALVWISLAAVLAPAFLLYAAPVLGAWLCSIPLAVWSSDARLGDWFARRGWFRPLFSMEEVEALGNLVLEVDRARSTPRGGTSLPKQRPVGVPVESGGEA